MIVGARNLRTTILVIFLIMPNASSMLCRCYGGVGESSESVHNLSMKPIALKVNGQSHSVTADPETPLLFVLNDDLGLRGPRFGCGMAQCGACTVIHGNQVIRSCVRPVGAVGDEITTLEGLGTPEKPHPIQQAFIDEGAAQCGFCLSGVILTAKAVLGCEAGGLG